MTTESPCLQHLKWCADLPNISNDIARLTLLLQASSYALLSMTCCLEAAFPLGLYCFTLFQATVALPAAPSDASLLYAAGYEHEEAMQMFDIVDADHGKTFIHSVKYDF